MGSRDDLIINPLRGKALLSTLDIPYTIYSGRSFNLKHHTRDIECQYNKVRSTAVTNIDTSDQLEGWSECLYSARTGENPGWTLGIAGQSNIAWPEMVAAQLALEYLKKAKLILWVNVTTGLSGERDLYRLASPYPVSGLAAVFVTGLRWDGDRIRFDKAFDLLRQTHPNTDRIVVGVGCDPLALTRKLDIPVQRVLNVVDSKTVQM